MFGFIRRFRIAWAYAKAAERKQQLAAETEDVPIKTKIAGMALVNGLLNREAVCTRCFNRFMPQERDFADKFQLRAILMVPDSAPEPILCDYCWDTTIASYNRQTSNVGTSNHGPPNLALRRLETGK